MLSVPALQHCCVGNCREPDTEGTTSAPHAESHHHSGNRTPALQAPPHSHVCPCHLLLPHGPAEWICVCEHGILRSPVFTWALYGRLSQEPASVRPCGGRAGRGGLAGVALSCCWKSLLWLASPTAGKFQACLPVRFL